MLNKIYAVTVIIEHLAQLVATMILNLCVVNVFLEVLTFKD